MIEAAFFFGRKKAAFFVVFNGQTQAKSISFLEKKVHFFLASTYFLFTFAKRNNSSTVKQIEDWLTPNFHFNEVNQQFNNSTIQHHRYG